jgi:Restriction endonuclease
MLLRNVLAGFLENLPNERAFDMPFLALLSDMGFQDVHFTHGSAEFGKDFIAKRRNGRKVVQYSFQSKAGDLGQGAWRSEVMPQMLEAVVSGLSHPRFDRNLRHQAVLVVTGRLTGNAPVSFQDFNHNLETRYHKNAVDLWDRERLVEYFLLHGPESFYTEDATGVDAFASFLSTYGAALRGDLRTPTIELHSRAWLTFGRKKKAFDAALESELLATACLRTGATYEAIFCILAQLRTTMASLHARPNDLMLRDIFRATRKRLATLADQYVTEIGEARALGGGTLLGAFAGIGTIVSYPAVCARSIEAAALGIFLGDRDQRARAEKLMVAMVAEDGSSHPLSDRWAVSQVAAVLALVAVRQTDAARCLLHRVTLWVADRYDRGAGLAEFDASAEREVEYLLGYPFSGVHVERRSSSLLATVLCDLAAFMEDAQFFLDVVNELAAVDIKCEYFQVHDTDGQFRIEGADVVQYPSVEYRDELSSFSELDFGSHVPNEVRTFALEAVVGPGPFVGLMLLLRDRYFPALWPRLA